VKEDNALVMLKNSQGKGFLANFGSKGVTFPRVSYNNAVVGQEELGNRYEATSDSVSSVVGGTRNVGTGTTVAGSSRCEDNGFETTPYVTLDGTPNVSSTNIAMTFTHYYNTLGGCPLPGDFFDSQPVADESEAGIGYLPNSFSYSCTRAGLPGTASTPDELEIYLDFKDVGCI